MEWLARGASSGEREGCDGYLVMVVVLMENVRETVSDEGRKSKWNESRAVIVAGCG